MASMPSVGMTSSITSGRSCKIIVPLIPLVRGQSQYTKLRWKHLVGIVVGSVRLVSRATSHREAYLEIIITHRGTAQMGRSSSIS